MKKQIMSLSAGILCLSAAASAAPSASMEQARSVLSRGAGEAYDGSVTHAASSLDAGLTVSDVYLRSAAQLKKLENRKLSVSREKAGVPSVKDRKPRRGISQWSVGAKIAAVIIPGEIVLFAGIAFLGFGLGCLAAAAFLVGAVSVVNRE